MSTLIERLRDYEKNCGDLGVNFYGRQIKELREALEAKDKEIAELRTQIEEQGAVDYVLDANAKEIASLRAALEEAMPFIADAGDDEDPEAQRRACALLEQIRAALERK